MNLLDLYKSNIKKYNTDKELWHSYISQVYNELFSDRLNAKKILEIGIRSGGSLLLWKDYFLNAEIYGIDKKYCEKISDIDKIIQITKDAYSLPIIEQNFDIIIDDGLHTLPSMIFTVQNYIKLLNNNGILVIEDIKNYDWFDTLIKNIPDNKKINHKIIDLRKINNRYDSMLLILEKSYG